MPPNLVAGSSILKLCCKNLDNLGIIIDNQKKRSLYREVTGNSGEKSPVKILVIPTNEELDIALQTCELILKDL